MRVHRFQVLQPQTQFPVRRRASTTSVSVSAFPETFPNRDIFRVLAYLYIFCCIVAAVVAMMAYTFFSVFRHMRAVASVDRAYYLRWFLLFCVGTVFFFRVPIGNISQALIGR